MRKFLLFTSVIFLGCAADTSEESVNIIGIGVFQPCDFEPFGKTYCFTRLIEFRGNPVELIIYATDNGMPPSRNAARELRQRFDRFNRELEKSFVEIPIRLRALCEKYGIETSHLSDDKIISGLVWHNIKLENEGPIECYTSNKHVTTSLDIVLRFSRDIQIMEVHFDG